jgi:hypothetical protein
MSDNTLALLQVCDLAKQWPRLQAVHDLAMADLLTANEEAKAELVKRADAKAEAEADAQAKVDAAQKAAASTEAKDAEEGTRR